MTDVLVSHITERFPAVEIANVPTVIVRPNIVIEDPIAIGEVDQGVGGSSPWLIWQGLKIPAHDYISLAYTAGDLTSVVFKTGGAGGATVATLTLAYTAGDLTSVTKT